MKHTIETKQGDSNDKLDGTGLSVFKNACVKIMGKSNFLIVTQMQRTNYLKCMMISAASMSKVYCETDTNQRSNRHIAMQRRNYIT